MFSKDTFKRIHSIFVFEKSCAYSTCSIIKNCSRFAHPHQPIPKQQILRRTPSVVIFGRASSCSRISPPLPPTSILLGALSGLSRGSLGALLGRCWGPLGVLWKGLGGLLGLSWRPSIKERGVSFLRPPVGARKVASWGLLGPLLGRSWARLGHLLGPSWGSLWPSWGHLEAPRAH